MEEMIAQCTQLMKQMNTMMSGTGGMMGSGMMGGGMMGGMMAPWPFLGWALVIGVIVLIMLAIVWTVRRSSGSIQPTETPLGILKRRLASGEIALEQFETMKRQLSVD